MSGMRSYSRSDLELRARAGQLTWLGPGSRLFARTLLASAAQGLVAAVFAARTTPNRREELK